MDPTKYLLVALISMAGSLVQATTGFGYAIICMALWPLVLPFRYAAVLECITAFFMVIGLAVKLRKHIDFKLVLFPFLASTATTVIGIFTMMSQPDAVMRQIFGGALVLLSVYFIFVSGKIHLTPSPLKGAAAGVLSGFFSGLFNVGGPPMVAYFLSVTQDKLVYNATLQCYFIFNTLWVAGAHLVMGNITPEVLRFEPAAIVGMLLGTLLGYRIFKALSIQVLKKLVYTFMALFGIYLLCGG